MSSKNKKAMGIAIVAGILLLIAGVNGVATWETVKEFVTEYVVDNDLVQIVFVILIFIASLGGIAVIIGGLLIGKDRVTSGKLLIAIGAGVGLIGLIVSLVIGFVTGNLIINSLLSLGSIGIILSIVARVIAK